MDKLLFTESKVVCMTEDKQCIVRGRDRYNRTICLVNEKSRLSILTYRNKTNAENYVGSVYKIYVSDAVMEKYNLNSKIYDEKTLGKLIGVKVNTYYEIE